MSKLSLTYPALYKAASDMSATSQNLYHRFLISEYALLFLAAVLSMVTIPSSLLQSIHALVFIALVILLLYRYKTKPEQDWYKGRALAESIKTSTWRYCLRASPFEDISDVRVRRSEFRNHLREILRANRFIGDRIPPDSAADDQITISMDEIRALSLEQRRNFYMEHRISEQRKWYTDKAGYNKLAAKRWVITCTVIYAGAIVLLVVRPSVPEWNIWPFEPLIVLASSIIGWMQIKKFNELTSAYTLTAHEIGIIQGRLDEVNSEDELSEFINEAELAFSREHTQWVARQNAL